MMKSTRWVGVLATGLISVAAFSGCASTPDPAMQNPSGAGGTAPVGMQLVPPASYTILSATDAPAGPTPAPVAWGLSGAGCVTCHGTVGQGVAFLAPEVRHTPAIY